jgi:hypothetical protein
VSLRAWILRTLSPVSRDELANIRVIRTVEKLVDKGIVSGHKPLTRKGRALDWLTAKLDPIAGKEFYQAKERVLDPSRTWDIGRAVKWDGVRSVTKAPTSPPPGAVKPEPPPAPPPKRLPIAEHIVRLATEEREAIRRALLGSALQRCASCRHWTESETIHIGGESKPAEREGWCDVLAKGVEYDFGCVKWEGK